MTSPFKLQANPESNTRILFRLYVSQGAVADVDAGLSQYLKELLPDFLVKNPQSNQKAGKALA